jgi:flagellar basal body-associated protein FliL
MVYREATKHVSKQCIIIIIIIIIITIIINGSTAHFLGLGRFFSFLILYTTGRTPLTGDQPIARSLLSTHTGQHKQNTRTQTPMPRVELQPMEPAFERAETVHAVDCAATMNSAVETQFQA